MAEPKFYRAKVEGEDAIRLYKSADVRLVRRAVIESLPTPEIDVRLLTIPEAMDAALDGVTIVDLTKQDAPTEPDLLDGVPPTTSGNAEPNGADATDETGGSARPSDQNTSDDNLPVGADDPRLAPGEWIDADGDIHSSDPDLEAGEPVNDEETPF